MKKAALGAILALALCVVSVATAPAAPTAQEKRQTLGELRTKVQTARDTRCRNPYQFKYRIRAMPDSWLRGFIRWTRGRVDYERDRSSRCLPTSSAGIIRYVFPSYAEDEAIRVAAAESTGDCYGGDGYSLNPYAKNPDSTASGLFQELSGWWDGSQNNYLGGQSFNPFNALANTRQARWLWASSGGTFAGHWAASAGCW